MGTLAFSFVLKNKIGLWSRREHRLCPMHKYVKGANGMCMCMGRIFVFKERIFYSFRFKKQHQSMVEKRVPTLSVAQGRQRCEWYVYGMNIFF
jgi:hypothetical protein